MPEFSPETIQLLQNYGLRALAVLGVLVAALVGARFARVAAVRALERAKVEATLAKFFANLIRYTILGMSALVCLSALGIETTSFAAMLGAAGLAVGLSLQSSLSNFAAGVLLLTFRPFKVGDFVNVAGTSGKVDEIELFSTRLITPDNRVLILPNASVFGSTIENVNALTTRRVDVNVGVAYGASIDETRRILEQAATSVEGVLPAPASQIMLNELGASSVDWVVRVWAPTDQYWVVRERVVRAVKLELDTASIGIPFPQVDVHLDAAIGRAVQQAAHKLGS